MMIGLWIFLPPNYFGLLFSVSPECMKKMGLCGIQFCGFRLCYRLFIRYTVYFLFNFNMPSQCNQWMNDNRCNCYHLHVFFFMLDSQC